jgi:5-methylcytosine-specific restriction endonuclease McrA
MKHISQAVRQQVRERAGQRCEYCRLPERFSFQPYQIDHVVARKHGGTDDITNLAWAWANCNNAKGSDQGSFDTETKEFVLFYNPRTQEWNDHFEMNAEVINGRTASGRLFVSSR